MSAKFFILDIDFLLSTNPSLDNFIISIIFTIINPKNDFIPLEITKKICRHIKYGGQTPTKNHTKKLFFNFVQTVYQIKYRLFIYLKYWLDYEIFILMFTQTTKRVSFLLFLPWAAYYPYALHSNQ